MSIRAEAVRVSVQLARRLVRARVIRRNDETVLHLLAL